MMFVGYMLSEFSCLSMCGLDHTPNTKAGYEAYYLSIEGQERHVRQLLIGTMSCCFATFLVFQGLLMLPASMVCCYDEWKLAGTWYTLIDPQGLEQHNVLQIAHVNNTATGTVLAFKMGSYFSECLAGVFLLLSHYAIYYYCEE